MKKKVTVKTERELSKYEFYCEKCETVHKMSVYCVAQLAQHNPLTYTCKCGNTIELLGFNE